MTKTKRSYRRKRFFVSRRQRRLWLERLSQNCLTVVALLIFGATICLLRLVQPVFFAGALTGFKNQTAKLDFAKIIITPESADCHKYKCLALTFDDGPSVETPRLLDILQRYQVPATFFVLGRQVVNYPDIVKRIASENHELGNHTFNHPELPRLSNADIVAEISSADQVLARLGLTAKFLRPPYGALNQRVLDVANRPIAMWSVDPKDWRDRHAPTVIDRAVTAATPGGIILFHDLYASTVDAVSAVIERLRSQGYVFVRMSDLIRQPQAKVIYRQME